MTNRKKAANALAAQLARTTRKSGNCGGNKNPDENIRACNRDIKANPSSATAYGNRSAAFFSKGDYDRAIKDASAAIWLDKKSHVAYNNRGLSYFKKGDFGRAIEDLSEAIRLFPYTGYFRRGQAYAADGQHRLAIKDFDKSISLNRGTAIGRKARAARTKAKRAMKAKGGRTFKLEPGAGKKSIKEFFSPSKEQDVDLVVEPKVLALLIGTADFRGRKLSPPFIHPKKR